MTKLFKYVLVALIAIGVTSSSSVAFAEQAGSVDIFDAKEAIGAIEPGLLGETSSTHELAIDSNSGKPSVSTNVGSLSNKAKTKSIESSGSQTSPDLTFTGNFLEDQVSAEDGLTIWSTQSPSVAAYAQSTNFGVRFFTALSSGQAPSSYSYEIDVPDGAYLKENEMGYMLLTYNGESLGQIQRPQAQDIDGKQIDTDITLDDGTLTQTLNLQNADVSYPVLAQAAWSYTESFFVPNKTPSQVRALLKDCFNCYFPVDGAPAAYPAPEQVLPLTVGVPGMPTSWDFTCIFTSDYLDATDGMSWFGFMFRAAKSHVDGHGSTISFDFNPYWEQGYPEDYNALLVVSAYIMNDDPLGVGQDVYQTSAMVMWSTFASRLEDASPV